MNSNFVNGEFFRAKKIVALTGAGVSTISGIPDFRSDNYDIWKRYKPEDVFSIERFNNEPEYFYSFCGECFPEGTDIFEPNAVHTSLARLEERGILHAVITQNIDGLHQKAGSKTVFELHGGWGQYFCVACKKRFMSKDLKKLNSKDTVPKCDACDGVIKPDIVFYGEMLPQKVLRNAITCAMKADLFIVLGSSLVVYPAASIPEIAISAGADLLIFNKQPTQYDKSAVKRFDTLDDFVELCGEILS